MPGKSPKASYVLPHTLAGERQRLALMSQLLDPMHRALIERLGLRLGWRCLEIGCGNGSISKWLASNVGPKGHVTATDIDLSYIDHLHAPNLEVRQLDILRHEVEPATYDLVTARAVLHHVKSPKKAVQHMVRFLKPNGVLLSIEPDFLPATAATPEALRAFWQAWLQWSASVGIDYFIGRKMPALLSASGLNPVSAEGTTAIYPGQSPWARYWLETLEELRPRLIESGYVSRTMLTHFNRLYSDPRIWTSAITFVASSGTKPQAPRKLR
ncbi:class I SAM-dependent methyltransferase [Edaphobacter aggregans]|uniref:class I SAM-dependent methyltransferase n=1 Tax=Edaphobacter aggregans TaxID=570835 RepID=UPI000690F5B9|nr:class I SAM-dependent methyltransferase [Edaphobacter aggregans]